MSTKKKLLQAAAGSAGGAAGLNVEQVFSTYLYEGNGSANVIDNGINLGQSNDGGSVDFANSGSLQVTPSDASLAFTGAFTWEAFVFFKTGIANNETIFEKTDASDTSSQRLILGRDGGDGKFRLWITGTDVNPNTSVMNAGTWYHVALTKDGSNDFRLFINGNLEFTYNKSGVSLSDNGIFTIGQNRDGAESMQGIISNVRIVNGTALYTSSFTAPTAALTDVTNTKLLTCQGDDPLVDNSANSLTVVNNGAKASSFGPFTAADAGEGGLVWIKERAPSTDFHILQDSERGAGKSLFTNNTNAEGGNSGDLIGSFNANGFTVNNTYLGGTNTSTNGSGQETVSWTFRKAPKFFDVVTYTGNDLSGRTVSHNLGSIPGCILVKKTSGVSDWEVYHRGLDATSPENYDLHLNLADARQASASRWNNTAPTSTEFTVGASANVNELNSTYVAYLFAHNDGDGDFGSTADQDIIKCGSHTNSAEVDELVDLGWEPQWILTKKTNVADDWKIFDTMRGLTYDLAGRVLKPNSSNAEADNTASYVRNTGFTLRALAGHTSIYIAIRRGPMAVPTAGTDVYKSIAYSGTSAARHLDTGFVTDLEIIQSRNSAETWEPSFRTRLTSTGNRTLNSSSTAAEYNWGTPVDTELNTYQHGTSREGAYFNSSGFNLVSHQFSRAPNYFDVVAYTGNGTAGRTVSHNLGVAPEMIWVKDRDRSVYWSVFHKDLGSSKRIKLNEIAAADNSTGEWNAVDPTSTEFTVGVNTSVNFSGDDYIAYLFASVDGVSKVGSYTGNGTSQTIDCGFSSGARFVLIKRTDDTANWIVYDSARGIVTGNDPFLYLNTTAAEDNTTDLIDPDSSGFIIDSYFADWNASGGNYIFYAIA